MVFKCVAFKMGRMSVGEEDIFLGAMQLPKTLTINTQRRTEIEHHCCECRRRAL